MQDANVLRRNIEVLLVRGKRGSMDCYKLGEAVSVETWLTLTRLPQCLRRGERLVLIRLLKKVDAFVSHQTFCPS